MKKILQSIFLSTFIINFANAADEFDPVENPAAGVPDTVELSTFACTDEEVEEYLDQSKNPLIKTATTPAFKEYKKAFQDVKRIEEEKTGSGPGGCLTIFDTYKFPKLPDDFFNFDPSSVTDIGAAILKAMEQALKDGYCYVIGGEFFEKQMDDLTDYNKKLRDQGIKKKHDPWMPQIMKKQLREKFKNDKYGRLKADALNFADPDHMDDMHKYFEYSIDDELDKIIEN